MSIKYSNIRTYTFEVGNRQCVNIVQFHNDKLSISYQALTTRTTKWSARKVYSELTAR